MGPNKTEDPRALLREYARILDRLRDIGVTRSKNNPVADYAEWLTARALGLELAPKSTRGYDAADADGLRYEVKARRVTADNGSRQLSAIRGIEHQHFDVLVGILFDHEFRVMKAASMPWQLVKQLAKHNEHTNSAKLLLRDAVWHLDGVTDVTPAIARAQTAL